VKEVEISKISNENFLIVSEMFYSIQGEGLTAGTPSVFLRVGNCNLGCKYCDTVQVWTKSKPIQIDKLVWSFDENGWINYLKRGDHLVITGGEPLLQQKQLINFIEALKTLTNNIFIEVETNGTIVPLAGLEKHVRLWNVSPKLSNSGVEFGMRINPSALQYFSWSDKAIFKFVVANEEDVKEAVKDFIIPYSIPRRSIFLMPLSSNREEYIKNSPKVVELCKQFGFRFSPRLQLEIWDKATGV